TRPSPPGSSRRTTAALIEFVKQAIDAEPDWPPTPGFLRLYVANSDATVQKALAAGATPAPKPTAPCPSSSGRAPHQHPRSESIQVAVKIRAAPAEVSVCGVWLGVRGKAAIDPSPPRRPVVGTAEQIVRRADRRQRHRPAHPCNSASWRSHTPV